MHPLRVGPSHRREDAEGLACTKGGRVTMGCAPQECEVSGMTGQLLDKRGQPSSDRDRCACQQPPQTHPGLETVLAEGADQTGHDAEDCRGKEEELVALCCDG